MLGQHDADRMGMKKAAEPFGSAAFRLRGGDRGTVRIRWRPHECWVLAAQLTKIGSTIVTGRERLKMCALRRNESTKILECISFDSNFQCQFREYSSANLTDFFGRLSPVLLTSICFHDLGEILTNVPSLQFRSNHLWAPSLRCNESIDDN